MLTENVMEVGTLMVVKVMMGSVMMKDEGGSVMVCGGGGGDVCGSGCDGGDVGVR